MKLLTPNPFHNTCLRHHESTEVYDLSHLDFIRMISIDGTSKEEPFKTTELRGKIWSEDIFKHFYAVVLKMNIFIQQLASLITDIAPAKTSENICLIWLATNIPLSNFFHLPLCYFSEGLMYTSYPFSTCTECSAKFVKSFFIMPFQHRLFRYSIHENDALYWNLILRTEVRQLCREKSFFFQ